MKEKHKKLIEDLRNYRQVWCDAFDGREYCEDVKEMVTAAKALEELSAAYDELEKKYTALNFKYAVLNSSMNDLGRG